MTEPTRGVCFFAYNTEQIDYAQLALLAASYVKRYMHNIEVAIITNQNTWNWLNQTYNSNVIENSIDYVVFSEVEKQTNLRTHHDSPWSTFQSNFQNANKHEIFDLTPFDQTLLIDIDYIIQNSNFEYIFGTDASVAMFSKAETLGHEEPAEEEIRLNPDGIDMWWSTVIYFDRRKELAKLFFDLWAHIADNYEYYRYYYQFPGHLYRTDYCVSIATHLLNGMNHGTAIDTFAESKMIYMSQMDDIVDVNDIDEWIYMVNNRLEPWKNILTNVKRENVHVMNKRALARHADKILELMYE